MRTRLSFRLPQSLALAVILFLVGGYALNRYVNRNTWAMFEDPQGRFSISYPAYWQAEAFRYGFHGDDDLCARFYDRPMFSSNSLDIYCQPAGQYESIEAWGVDILDRRSNISRIGDVYPATSDTQYLGTRARDYEIGRRRRRQVYIQSGATQFIISHDVADLDDSRLKAIMAQMLASFEIKE
jgi:hypothetical protein